MARNTGSDELYRLVHSLTTEEKGYFKKFAKRHTSEGNNYLKLFDAVNKQEVFEEVSLKKKFKAYAVMKNYLFEMILNSMLIYGTNDSLHAELRKQLFHISFLQKKGLPDKAIQLTERGLKKAEQSEMFAMQEEFRKTLHTATKLSIKPSERNKFNQKFFDDLRFIRYKQQERDALLEIFQKLLSIDHEQSFNNRSFEKFARELSINELIKKETTASVGANRMRLAVLDRYYYFKKDFEGQYRTAKSLYNHEKKLWHNNSPMKDYDTYIKSFRVLINSCIPSKRFNEALKLAEEMNNIGTGNEMVDAENRMIYFIYRQYIFWGTGNHIEGDKYTKSNFPHRELNQFGEKFRLLRMEIYKCKMLFEFSNRNYDEIFKSIASLELLDLKKYAPYYYKSCELLKLILQIELGNFELLPEMLSNVMKHLPKYGLTTFEKQMFSPFRKISETNKTKYIDDLYHKLLGSKKAITLFHILNYKLWLKSQFYKKPLSGIIASE